MSGWNYGPPGRQYGAPGSSYNQYNAGPPGMGPPGMSGAPGASPSPMGPPPGPPPGMNGAAPGAHGFQPPNFVPPNAHTIYFTTPNGQTEGSAHRRPGQADGAYGGRRDGQRTGHQDFSPAFPTYEELMRTLYVSNITEEFGSEADVQAIVGAGGGLRRFARLRDPDGKVLPCGFAEYEDADSIAVAIKVLEDVTAKSPAKPVVNGHAAETNGVVTGESKLLIEDVPKSKDQETGEKQDGEEKDNEDQDDKSHMNGEHDDAAKPAKLVATVDEKSLQYIDNWKARGALMSDDKLAFRIDQARDEIHQILSGGMQNAVNGAPHAEPVHLADAPGVFHLNINMQGDDELQDIPDEMRESLRVEIAEFRKRSQRRDVERLSHEEELEQDIRQKRKKEASRTQPEKSALKKTPAGPKGPGLSGLAASLWDALIEDVEDADDHELEKRRDAKSREAGHGTYVEDLRSWRRREKAKLGSQQRIRDRKDERTANSKSNAAAEGKRLAEVVDEENPSLDDFNGKWAREVDGTRKSDRLDRDDENAEIAEAEAKMAREQNQVDKFFDDFSAEMAPAQKKAAPRAQARFQMSLGAAAKRAQERLDRERHATTGIEHLLDTQDQTLPGKRVQLHEIEDEAPVMDADEIKEASGRLAREIPSDMESLWAWKVKWDVMDEAMIEGRLRGFVGNKIMEALGSEEEMLVDEIVEGIRAHKAPQDIIADVEGALDEDAAPIMKKVWRMLVFCTEAVTRNIPY